MSNSVNDNILAGLALKKAKKQPINLYEVLDLIDFNEDYSEIKELLIKEKITSPRGWDKAVQVSTVKKDLGGYPENAMEYLKLTVEKNNIQVDYKGNITESKDVYHEGINISKEIKLLKSALPKVEDKSYKNAAETLRMYQDIESCKTQFINVGDLMRMLRIKAREYALPYSAMDIDDVTQEWIKEERPNRKFAIFSNVMYDPLVKSRANGEWEKMIDSCFDLTDLDSNVVRAVVEKFIYQVKRKIQDKEVNNHMMIVLLGEQGKGKSTWMTKFLKPIEELTAATDFNQITDDRNIDLWENYVLLMDEMGFASNADIESVKNIITSNKLSRRIMRTNNSIQVKQSASFIGASNKELDQLIRDETGLRRFISLRYSKNPNWNALNSIDFQLLWQSVDELGDDPIVKYLDILKEEQERIRNLSQCEEWANSLPVRLAKEDKFKKGEDLFFMYKDWEKDHYTNRTLDYNYWAKEMRRLANNVSKFQFIIRLNAETNMYEFKYVIK